jgi:hypothetical protein
MRHAVIGSAVLFAVLSQMPPQQLAAATARAGNGAAQQAIVECRARYSGDRGQAGNLQTSSSIESCFKGKTGRYPFELGIPLYPPGYDPRHPDPNCPVCR